MPLIGPELIVVIILLILLFRPKTITDIARGLGKMVREFREGESEERKKKLREVAKQLGIETEGKTEEQILEEIKRKLSS